MRRCWPAVLLLLAACQPAPGPVSIASAVDVTLQLDVKAPERTVQEAIPAWSRADVAAIELWETGSDHRITETSTRSLSIPSAAIGRPVFLSRVPAGRRFYFVGRAVNADRAVLTDDRDRNHHLDLDFGDPAVGGLDNEQTMGMTLTLTSPYLADLVANGSLNYTGLVGSVESATLRLRDRSNSYNEMLQIPIPAPSTFTGFYKFRVDFGHVAPNTLYKLDYVVSCKDGVGTPYWTILRGLNRATIETEATNSVSLTGTLATKRIAFTEIGASADGKLTAVTLRNMTPYSYNLANYLLVAATPTGTASFKFPSTGMTLAYKATTSVTVAQFPGMADAAELGLVVAGTTTNPAQIGDPNLVEFVGIRQAPGLSYGEPAMYTGIWPANNERIGPLTATRSLNPAAYTTPLFGSAAWSVTP